MFKLIRENPNALAFALFQTIHNFATQIVVPFFSIILFESNWDISSITYFFAFFTLAQFLFSPMIGKISNMVQRKKLIFFGLLMQIIFFQFTIFQIIKY